MPRIALAITIALCLAAPKIAAAEVKIAYVDLQAAVVGVDDGKAARARLQAWIDQSEAALKKEQDAVKAEHAQLEKQSSTMSATVRETKMKAISQKVLALQEKFSRMRDEAQSREQKEMAPIIAKLDAAIKKIAEKQGLDFVLDKRDSGMLFGRAKYDITSEVIRDYNAKK